MSVSTKEEALSGPEPSRLALLWASTVGKKALMALSGLVLFAYVVAHLLGNLRLYAGREAIDGYARFLHESPGLLWTARVILLAAVLVHAVAGIQLWLRRHEARPIDYRSRENIQASAASRTMIWSGFAIGAFVVYHVADLTLGVAHSGPFVDVQPFANVTSGFSHPVPALLYVAAMVALGFHLWHGVYSMFGSLGLSHPRYTEGVKRLAALAATLIALGNVSIPVAVLTGLVRG